MMKYEICSISNRIDRTLAINVPNNIELVIEGTCMKLDEGFIIRNIAGEDVLVPIGSKVIKFKGLMTMTPVGGYIYRLLMEGKNESEIIDAILQEYDIDRQTAENDLIEFIANLRELKVLDDE